MAKTRDGVNESRAERKARIARERDAQNPAASETGQEETGQEETGQEETGQPAEAAKKKAAKKENMVVAMVPKKYDLRLDHETVVHFLPGVQDMERAHAEHWYSKAHGVQVHGE